MATAFLLVNIMGCSSTGGGRAKSQDGREAAAGETEGGSRGSGEESGASTKEAPINKTELYDGIKIALSSGEDQSVEKAVANLLSHDQSDFKALNALGLFHLSKGRTQLAKTIFKSIIEKDTKNVSALNNLGVLYSQEGDRKKAMDSFKRAVSINSIYPSANANLGSIYAVGKDFQRARPYLENAYKGGLRDLSVLTNYAAALMFDGDSEAGSVFIEALKMGSSDVNLQFNYALYLTYIKKDYKEASEIIDKIRFMGVPAQKKSILARMEETIIGSKSEETKAP
jgi:Tfp pilus assembly protein PilF